MSRRVLVICLPRLGNSLVYARMVGGSRTHFTANFWRFHQIDFHERSVLGSIAGTGFADCPISYRAADHIGQFAKRNDI
jgi:hypothetical protein